MLIDSLLSERDASIVRLRFEQDHTQAKIGAQLGMSQMHVSRRLRQAIETLRSTAETGTRELGNGGCRPEGISSSRRARPGPDNASPGPAGKCSRVSEFECHADL